MNISLDTFSFQNIPKKIIFLVTQTLTVVSCAIRFIELKITLHIMYMVNYLQSLGRLCSNRRITAIVEIIRQWARNRGVLYTSRRLLLCKMMKYRSVY